jgi:hypothetical protein
MLIRRWCFNYQGLILACISSLATSLLFTLQEGGTLSSKDALRAFLQTMIAGVAYAQNPFVRPRMAGSASARDDGKDDNQ